MILTKLFVGVLGFNMVAMAGFTSIGTHVDAALKSVTETQSFHEWQQLGMTPEQVFELVDRHNDPRAWQALCRKLATLKDEDLAFFDNEITHGDHARDLKCGPALQKRLATYWSRQAKLLEASHETIAEIAAPTGQAPVSVESDPKLPSIEKEIDFRQGPVFFDGGLKHGEIAITIDDGPHPTRTPRILKALRDAGVRVTFFSVGEMAKASVDATKKKNDGSLNLLQQEIADGHTVGSHSWNHPDLARMPLVNAVHNILLGHDTVMSAAGIETPFFRFPYGSRNKAIQAEVSHGFPSIKDSKSERIAMATFFWNMDSSDWKLRNPSALFANVVHELDAAKGGIILFHDIQEQTAIIMPHVLQELKKRNFTTVVFVPKLEKPQQP